MSIRTGIAILGIWTFAGACAISKYVTGVGLWLGVIVCFLATWLVIR